MRIIIIIQKVTLAIHCLDNELLDLTSTTLYHLLHSNWSALMFRCQILPHKYYGVQTLAYRILLLLFSLHLGGQGEVLQQCQPQKLKGRKSLPMMVKWKFPTSRA
jgi:hypothetical protein